MKEVQLQQAKLLEKQKERMENWLPSIVRYRTGFHQITPSTLQKELNLFFFLKKREKRVFCRPIESAEKAVRICICFIWYRRNKETSPVLNAPEPIANGICSSSAWDQHRKDRNNHPPPSSKSQAQVLGCTNFSTHVV